MEQIRLVALDLDGTVFNDQKEITPRTLVAIRAALQKGVTVLPATGRTADGVPEQFTGIPGVRYALTSNGASVVDLQTGEQLVSLPFAPDLARRTYRALLPFGGMLSIFIGGKSYTTRENAELSLDITPPNLRSYFRKTRIEVEDMDKTLLEHAHEVEKFSMMYATVEQRDAAWRGMEAACPELEIASSIERNLELSAPGVTKGRGLMALAAHLGLTPGQVMAVGDSGNDLTMVQMAGLGVAMANATPDVLAAADVVTGDNNHDGVAQAIEKYVL